MTENGRTLVLKFGGSAFAPEALRPFADRIRAFHQAGDRVVIVHGGGKEINALLERLGKKSVFIDGLRVTDDDTLDVVEMVLSGRVNKALVRALLSAGVPSAGIAGTDGALLLATRLVAERAVGPGQVVRVEYGNVGEVTEVHPGLLHALLQSRYVPVVSPLALAANGHVLNVNADTAAARIAGALRADAFLLLTDVPGVHVPEGTGRRVASHLTPMEVQRLKGQGTITGGMIPKVDACLQALGHGARAARIASLGDFLNQETPMGTAFSEA